MKQLLLAFLFLPALLMAQTGNQSAEKGFIITGHVTGLPDSSEVKITNVNDNSLVASTRTKDASFTLKGSIQEPGLYWLTLGSTQAQYIYLENTKMTVTGDASDIKTIVITGSRSHADFLAFQKIFNPLVGERNATVAKINKGASASEYDSLMNQYELINAQIQKEIDQFITQRPESAVSPWVLFVTESLADDVMQLERRFLLLDQSVKELHIGKSLAEYIAYNKVGAVGTEAIDFTQPDTAGKEVKLSSFRGQYVLVDFWASWCGPCRHENPNVVANYNKFREKNFTVLGVSLDRPGQKEKWLEAIKTDGLAWTQVSDLKFWQNEAAQLYRVEGIPFNILVDPDGKIVARNLRGPQLEEKLCELLGCN